MVIECDISVSFCPAFLFLPALLMLGWKKFCYAAFMQGFKTNFKKTKIKKGATFLLVVLLICATIPLTLADLFGDDTEGGNALNFCGYIRGSLFTYSGGDGKNATSISALLGSGSSTNHHVKYAIYDNATRGLLAVTEEGYYTLTTAYEWKTLNLTAPLSLTNGTVYILCAWADGAGGSIKADTGTSQAFYDTDAYDGNYPAEITPDTWTNHLINIYATYEGEGTQTLSVPPFTITSADGLSGGSWDSATLTLTFTCAGTAVNITNTDGYGYPASLGLYGSAGTVIMSNDTLVMTGLTPGEQVLCWMWNSGYQFLVNSTGTIYDVAYNEGDGTLTINGSGNMTVTSNNGFPSGEFIVTVNGEVWTDWELIDGVIYIYNVPEGAIVVIDWKLPSEEDSPPPDDPIIPPIDDIIPPVNETVPPYIPPIPEFIAKNPWIMWGLLLIVMLVVMAGAYREIEKRGQSQWRAPKW